MKAQDFERATFTAEEVDGAWHVYAALLAYSIQAPSVLHVKGFASALDESRALFDLMYARLER